MEENEKKEMEENEPEAPKGDEEKPAENANEQPEGKGGRLDALKGKAKVVKDKAKEKAKVVKQKTSEFMGVKRNRIIVLACSGAAIVALVVGLSVGLTQCHSNGGDNTSSSNSNSESKGGEGGSSSSSSSQSSSSAHTHEYGTAWKSDATKHWHECSADGAKSDEAVHTFGAPDEIIRKATESQAGLKGYRCSVCEYAKDTFEYNPYISAETFEDAFKFTESKFAIDATFTKGENNAWDGDSIMARDGDLARSYNKWTSDDGTVKELDNYYSREESEGSYTYYTYSLTDGAWAKKEDSEDKFFNKYFNPLDFRGLLFTNLAYSSLTFDSTSESYKGQCTRGSTTFDVEVFFNNGRFIKFITKADGKTSTYTVRTTPYDLTTPHVHDYGASWESNATSHWHECSADGAKSGEAVHTFGDKMLDLNGATPKIVETCSVCGYENSSEYTSSSTFKGILYGYYPQTHVSDTATIASLNALTSADTTTGWYLLGDEYYVKANGNPPYPGFKFSDGTTIVSNTSYWFKCDPIEWKVYHSSNDEYSLVSTLLLESRAFNDNNNTAYTSSSLKTWLNENFYNHAFPSGESYLQSKAIDNVDNKVYILNEGELSNTAYFVNDGARQAKPSDYALANNAYVEEGYGRYWTATSSSTMVYFVTCSGGFYPTNPIYYTGAIYVRPAITVKIS